MRKLSLISILFLSLCFSGFSQRQDIRGTGFLPNIKNITPDMSAETITNIISSVSPWTVVAFASSTTPYWIRTNNMNWRKPQVSYYIPRGTTVIIGDISDSVQRVCTFNDCEGAKTNWIYGGGTLIMSNNQTCMFTQALVSSYIYIQLDSILAHTSTGQPIAVLSEGTWWLEWSGEIGPNGYDTLIIGPSDYPNSTRVRGHFLSGTASSGQAIEAGSTGHGDPTRNIWEIDYIYQKGDAGLGDLCTLPDGITLRNTYVYCSTNTEFVQYMSGKNTIWENVHVSGVSNNMLYATSLGGGGRLTLIGCTFSNTWPTAIPVNLEGSAGETYEMRNCKISSLTNNITANVALGIDVVGTLSLTKGVHDFVSINGLTSGNPITNNFIGTNVFVNVGGATEQVVVLTNNALIVWTNTASLLSGKEITASLYNNTGSNISLWHAGGVRFLGGASNIVNAGKEIYVTAKKIGTNTSLIFYPQVN